MIISNKKIDRPTQAITDADSVSADDIALLANTPTQAGFMLHSQEQAAIGIGPMSADKAEFMCFNQRGVISKLNGRSQEQVNQFTYLGSNVSSNENDISTRRAKA